MKSVLISIQPKWCELIANSKKTIEIRKTAPKLQTPFKCYIYCTNSYIEPASIIFSRGLRGYVIGEFVCDRVAEVIHAEEMGCLIYDTSEFNVTDTCLSKKQIAEYANGHTVYGWHISDLKIYDKPKELGEFKPHCNPNTCVGCRYFHNGASSETTHCSREAITHPPQSWCYVEG